MRLEQEARVDRMTAIERVETVLRGEIPDRVPVDLHDFMVAAYASGRPFPEYFRDGQAMAEGQIAAGAGWRAHPGSRLRPATGDPTREPARARRGGASLGPLLARRLAGRIGSLLTQADARSIVAPALSSRVGDAAAWLARGT